MTKKIKNINQLPNTQSLAYYETIKIIMPGNIAKHENTKNKIAMPAQIDKR